MSHQSTKTIILHEDLCLQIIFHETSCRVTDGTAFKSIKTFDRPLRLTHFFVCDQLITTKNTSLFTQKSINLIIFSSWKNFDLQLLHGKMFQNFSFHRATIFGTEAKMDCSKKTFKKAVTINWQSFHISLSLSLSSNSFYKRNIGNPFKNFSL